MILVVGSYGAGITARVPRMPEAGETIGESTVSIGHGGKSSNQAVTIARQGCAVQILTAIGNDSFGTSAKELWVREGVGHEQVKVVENSTMSGIILVEPNGENRIAIAPGALSELTPGDMDQNIAAFKAADVVVVCLEIPIKAAERAITLAKECGAIVVLNPAPAAALNPDVIAQTDYFIPNQTEYEFYLEQGYNPPAGQTLVVTQGQDGVMIQHGDTEHHAPPFPQSNVVDTTGAGDTFVGTFAAAIASGLALVPAVQRAIVASSLSVTVAEVIPSIPDAQTVDLKLSEYLKNIN